jgi:hypothetical protein
VTTLSVPEDALPLRPVLRVTANDLDVDNGYGDVRYALEGPSREFFRVNETTGEVFVGNGARLDRETTDKIELSLVAYDTPQGGPSRRQSKLTVSPMLDPRLLSVCVFPCLSFFLCSLSISQFRRPPFA